MAKWIILAACAFAACTKQGEVSEAITGPSPGDARVEPIDALVKVDVRECEHQYWQLMADVRSAYIAKERLAPQRTAIATWPTVKPPCRNGQWYLAAALLLDLSTTWPLEVGAIHLATDEAALTAALTQPDDIDVLERVALVSALGRKPALPADACQRARAVNDPRTYLTYELTDRVHYVCARAAIAAGNGTSAKLELEAIQGTPFPDLELARAQIAKLLGDLGGARQHARLAIKRGVLEGMVHLASPKDIETIRALATQISK